MPFTIKITPSGNTEWVKVIDGPAEIASKIEVSNTKYYLSLPAISLPVDGSLSGPFQDQNYIYNGYGYFDYTDFDIYPSSNLNVSIYTANVTTNTYNTNVSVVTTSSNDQIGLYSTVQPFAKVWKFEEGIVFPDSTVQNTAYTGTYDVGGFVSGSPGSIERIFQFSVATPFSLQTDSTGYIDAYATASNTSTSDATFTIYKNTDNVGVMMFDAGLPFGRFQSDYAYNPELYANTIAFLPGDYLLVVAPFAVDATLADFSFTFRGVKN